MASRGNQSAKRGEKVRLKYQTQDTHLNGLSFTHTQYINTTCIQSTYTSRHKHKHLSINMAAYKMFNTRTRLAALCQVVKQEVEDSFCRGGAVATGRMKLQSWPP